MKKSEQLLINEQIVNAYDIAIKQIDHKSGTRLRNCTAWVYETEDYYFLRSFNTIVAFICKNTDTLYDVLRYVYGFTRISASHIAKFSHDYGAGKWGCEHEFRYYNI